MEPLWKYAVHLDNITIIAAHENDFWQKRGHAICCEICKNVVEVVARGHIVKTL